MPSFIALDIETTGLDPYNDAIIEIGAVRFNGKRIEQEWSTLVNPGRPIPQLITQLTGINNEMIRNAPSLKEVLYDLAQFVGNLPIIGHSIGFDLSFLQPHGVFLVNEVMDTYELSSVLLPTASRYNLGALGQQLGILLPASHRALDDARVTHAVYNRLYEKALQLPLGMVAEFIRLGEPLDWRAIYFFTQVLRDLQKSGASAEKLDVLTLFPNGKVENVNPLTPPDVLTPLDVDEVAAILEQGGAFQQFFASYEHRPQQVEMLRAVTHALSHSQHLMVEAGTGTGKSFAYLVPAALWSLQNQLRVVISTNTINLQDQLTKKDLPDLRAALNIDLHYCVLKGRSNYLCPRRLESLRNRHPETVEQMRVLAKVLVWLLQGGSGDRNEINLNSPAERNTWNSISAEDEGCTAETCLERTGGACPFYRAHQAAQAAHIIVVNHALLLADVATGNRVLPEYQYLIVDEAHHIEAATTDALSFRINQADFTRLCNELGGTSTGILGHILSYLKQVLNPSNLAAMQQAFERATDLLFHLNHNFHSFMNSIDFFLSEAREGKPLGQYGQQARILPATRTQPFWTDVELTWDAVHETLTLLLNLLQKIHKDLGEINKLLPAEELEDMMSQLASTYSRLAEADAHLHSLVSDPQAGNIYWAEINANGNHLALQVAPLHIGPLMEQFLWHEKSSVILTSATLTTEGEFNYLRNRLNADEADELLLGSPFDYETSALLYLVNDIPEPNDPNCQRAIEHTITRLAKATGGRMLALFTSYAQLKRTSKAIAPALLDADITVFEQGEGASANTLLETFRETDKAVLLGTRSFWEGVDIPGEALSVLVIVKLPFDVPSDPIVAARSETFDDPFTEYQLPEAILRFRQGFGRLIRTQSDRGVVAILDKRILSKRYGKAFTDSLPECKVKVGSMNDLPGIAARWLNL